MAEWLKAHAWKACVRETVPWVRIPLSPPHWSTQCFLSRKQTRPRLTLMSGFEPFRKREGFTPLDILCMPLDDPGRCGEPFNGSNSLLEPPSIFGSPILELPVDAEIMGPVLRDI